MKKATVFFVVFAIMLCSFCMPVYAEETVFFGNFEPITFFVGLGSREKLLNGISAIDPYTNEDITEKVEIQGTVDFYTVGVYNVSYSVVDSAEKTWGVLRKVSVVELDSDVEYINIDHGRNYLESIDFEMIKNTAFELRYLLYTENYEKLLYSWSFTGEDIYNPPRRMSVTITNSSSNYEAISVGVGQANFQILNFEYKEKFPSEAEIFFAVDESFDKNTTLYLYSYGEAEGFKLIADSISINDVHYASCKFEKGGEYVLTDKKVGYSNNSAPQFSSSADNNVSFAEGEYSSEIQITPGFNETASQTIQDEKHTLNDTEKNIYLLVIIGAAFVVLVAVVLFVVFSKNEEKKR